LYNWNNVTVAQYKEIKELDSSDLTPLELILERIAILTDNDYFDLYEDELNDILIEYEWINTPPLTNQKTSFKHLTFGNFIDLENYCTEKTPIENIDKICATIKGYESLTDECDKILSESIVEHYTTLENYVKYRLQILDKYKGLFEDEDPEPEDEDEKEIKEKKTTGENWLNIIYQLAKGDVTKANEVTELSHIMVLNWLSLETKNQPSKKKL
tara:strand:+ start:505 stop:1146 length:642 start_codon:yes stop_codon:yes gene_type:complete